MTIIDLEKSLSELHEELERLLPAIQLTEKAVETVNIARAIPEKHQQLISELKSVFINPDELERNDFSNVYTVITKLLSDLESVKTQIIEYERNVAELIDYLKNNDIPKKLEAINFQLTGISNSLLTIQGNLNSVQNLLTSLTSLAQTIRNNSENIISELTIAKTTIDSILNIVTKIDQNANKIIGDIKNFKSELIDKINLFKNEVNQKFENIEQRQNKQDKQLKIIKILGFAITTISIIGIISIILILTMNPS